MITMIGILTWSAIAVLLFIGSSTTLLIANEKETEIENWGFQVKTIRLGDVTIEEIWQNGELLKSVSYGPNGKIIQSFEIK